MATEAFEELAETFAFLTDWEDRYGHVIDMGRNFAPLADAEKVPGFRVDGCMSQVWLVPEISGSGPDAVFDFRAESDAMIVRGLVAVVHALYAGLSVSDVLEVDAARELGRLGLEQHLSAQRTNGVRAMIGRIRSLAEAAKG